MGFYKAFFGDFLPLLKVTRRRHKKELLLGKVGRRNSKENCKGYYGSQWCFAPHQ